MQNGVPVIGDNLGGAIRERRVRDHLSLRALAERTGFSPSFLSQVENGQSSPSLSSIKKITAALNIPLGQFFNSLDGPQIEPMHDLKEWFLQWSQSEVTPFATPNDGASLAGFLVTVECGGGSTSPHSLPFDQFAYVLEGDVSVTVDTQRHNLPPGHALTLHAGRCIYWQNPGAQRARILLVFNTGSRQNRNFSATSSRPVETERRPLAG